MTPHTLRRRADALTRAAVVLRERMDAINIEATALRTQAAELDAVRAYESSPAGYDDRVEAAIVRLGRTCGTGEIAAAAAVDRRKVIGILARLRASGRVVRVLPGLWALPVSELMAAK